MELQERIDGERALAQDLFARMVTAYGSAEALLPAHAEVSVRAAEIFLNRWSLREAVLSGSNERKPSLPTSKPETIQLMYDALHAYMELSTSCNECDSAGSCDTCRRLEEWREQALGAANQEGMKPSQAVMNAVERCL